MLIDTTFDPEPGIDPIVARMRDIILAKAAEGEPTMKSDLAEFDQVDVDRYFAAAKREADKQVVRQVEDGRGFESRHQLLTRAAGLCLGLMPTEAEIHAKLRSNGIGNAEIADLWPDLLNIAAQAFVAARMGADHGKATVQ